MGLRELCAELAEELKALKALRKRIADMRAALREEQPSSVWMIVPTSPCYVVRKEVDGKLVERVYYRDRRIGRWFVYCEEELTTRPLTRVEARYASMMAKRWEGEGST